MINVVPVVMDNRNMDFMLSKTVRGVELFGCYFYILIICQFSSKLCLNTSGLILTYLMNGVGQIFIGNRNLYFRKQCLFFGNT